MTTPNALTQALEASQAKAVAALGKAYVRRAAIPDDELFRGLMHKVGLDDDVAISFLLHAWAILREQREQPLVIERLKAGTYNPDDDALPF